MSADVTNQLTEQEYIAKAVDLADGFQLTNCGRYFSMPHGGYVPAIEECPRQYADALAMQLWRQVILHGHDIDVRGDGAVEVPHQSRYIDTPISSAHTICPAMNLIKAIVDSKVLEKNDE